MSALVVGAVGTILLVAFGSAARWLLSLAERNATDEARTIREMGLSPAGNGFVAQRDGCRLRVRETVILDVAHGSQGTWTAFSTPVASGDVVVECRVEARTGWVDGVHSGVAALRFVSGDPLRREVTLGPAGWTRLVEAVDSRAFRLADGEATFYSPGRLPFQRLAEWAARLAAVGEVASMSESEVHARAVQTASTDPDEDRRARMLRALAFGAPLAGLSVAMAASASAKPARERDAAWLVRAAAGEDTSAYYARRTSEGALLGDLEAVSAWATLRALLPGFRQHAEPEVVAAAVRLARIEAEPGPELVALIGGSELVDRAVLETLLAIGAPQAEDVALRLLDGPHRPLAVRVLGEVGTVRSVERLQALATSSWGIGETAADAQEAILRVQGRLGPVEAGWVDVATGGGEVAVASGGEVDEAGPKA